MERIENSLTGLANRCKRVPDTLVQSVRIVAGFHQKGNVIFEVLPPRRFSTARSCRSFYEAKLTVIFFIEPRWIERRVNRGH